MSGQRLGALGLAALGLMLGAIVLVLGFDLTRSKPPSPAAAPDMAALQSPGTGTPAPVWQGDAPAPASPSGTASPPAAVSSQPAPSAEVSPSAPTTAAQSPSVEARAPDAAKTDTKAAAAPVSAAPAPAFDIVRVEPTGESVIAGRGAAGATVEMVRNGETFARVVADTSGLFALVPPPLPPGSHEIALRTIAPDGTRAQSREAVAVVVDPGRKKRPLVAMTSPDKPTVVLSTPESGEPAPSVAAAPQAPAPRPSVKVSTVEADEGRLDVTGRAAPGASIRLYLNETLVAPGSVGADGSVSFVIQKGIRPGEYRIRLDEVDPVSGAVRSRAEVPFTMPATVALPVPPAVPDAARTLAERQPTPVAPRRVAESPAPAPAAAPTPSRPAASPPVVNATPVVQAAPAPGLSVQDASSQAASIPSTRAAPAPAGTAAGTQVAAAGGPATMPSLGPSLERAVVVVPEVVTAIVARGDSLWQISRRTYGRGMRYTAIYTANQQQIRDPKRIYPGQVFVLPGSGPN
ncbi:MAG TPA: LysM peptidoglycan-binding domain-containing protein [Beijerinckiaceae bacterium]|jgi:nucleoid-associated protein YgaU